MVEAMSRSIPRPRRSPPKRPRPRRQHEIKIRLSDNELRAVETSAAACNRYLSEYIRMAAVGQVEPSSPPQPEVK